MARKGPAPIFECLICLRSRSRALEAWVFGRWQLFQREKPRFSLGHECRHVFQKRFTFFSGRVNVNREKPRFSRLTKANLKAFEDFAKAPGENLVFGGWLVLNNPLPPSPADFTFSRGAAPELRSRTLQKRLVKDCFQGAHGRKRGFSRTPSSGT